MSRSTLVRVGSPGVLTGGIWQPTDLNAVTWSRPVGTEYVTWESLVSAGVASAQAASPNVPVMLTSALLKGITGNKILSLPAGIFERTTGFGADFVNGRMIGIGVGYATGMRGIVGSGSRSTRGINGSETIIRMQDPVSTVPAGPGLIIANAVASPYFGGFSLIGRQSRGDGVFHAGINLNTCTGTPLIERLYMRGINPGYSQVPPGETFGVNIFHTPNAQIRDCEIDGRDEAGARTCASPMGWNTVVNDLVTKNVVRVYAHHGISSMLTFWETTNFITEDYYAYSWAAGGTNVSPAGNLKGSGINHEQSEGRIRHIRPRLFLNTTKSAGPVNGAYGHDMSDDQTKTTNTSSGTFGVASGRSDTGLDFEMWYPQWDNNMGSSGVLCMTAYNGYALGNALVTTPRIYLQDASGADYTLSRFDHPTSGWNTRPPLRDFAWIH